jgi:hypothetical protein
VARLDQAGSFIEWMRELDDSELDLYKSQLSLGALEIDIPVHPPTGIYPFG